MSIRSLYLRELRLGLSDLRHMGAVSMAILILGQCQHDVNNTNLGRLTS